MALSANTVWEVRTAGADTNGGGFVTGASGTDWSQQDAAQYAVTDAVTNGTTTITSVSANFGTDVVGNILYITGGTAPITAGWYEITARTDAATITVDRSTGLTAGTGATLNIGGALITVGQALTNTTVGNQIIYIKAGTYNITTALATAVSAGSGVLNTRVIGYNATRGDAPTGAGRPTIATNGNAINALNVAHNYWDISHVIFDGAGATRGLIGINITGNWCNVTHCKFKDFNTRAVSTGAVQVAFVQCEFTACSQGITAAGAVALYECAIHANTGTGVIISGNQPTLGACIIVNNTGASSDGIAMTGSGYVVKNCTIYGNGRDGVRNTTAFHHIASHLMNNLIVSNGGYGFNFSGGRAAAYAMSNYNAFYNNTSGNRNVILAGANDVTLTADPFTDAAGGNFALNATSGGGAALRATGFPGVFPGVSTTGYIDIGAIQSRPRAGQLVNSGVLIG